GSGIQRWAEEGSTKTAAVISAVQLATEGAKFLIMRRFFYSPVSISANIFSAVQLWFFSFGFLYSPQETRCASDFTAADGLKNNVAIGTVIVLQSDGRTFQVVLDANNIRVLREIR